MNALPIKPLLPVMISVSCRRSEGLGALSVLLGCGDKESGF
jgi:hypothetical protein